MSWRRLFGPKQRIVGSAFLMDLAYPAVGLAVQFNAIALGASPTILGLLGTFSGAMYTLGCLFSGRLSDRVGRRRTILTCVVLLAGCWTLMANATHLWQLLGLVTMGGALVSLFWPSVMAWLAELTSGSDRALRRVLGVFNAAWSGGAVIGMILAGVIWDLAGPNTFYCLVAFVLMIALLARTVPIDVAPWAASSPRQQPPEDLPPGPDTYRLLVTSRIGVYAAWFGRGVIITMFPKLGTALGFSSTIIGIIISLSLVPTVVTFGVASSTSRWQYRTWPLWLGTLTGIVGMALAALARTPAGFAAALMITGVFAGMSYTLSQFYGLHGRANEKGTSMGMHEAAIGAGVVTGSLLGGLVATYFNLHAPFALAGLVALLAGLAQVAVWPRLGKGSTPPQLPGHP